MIANNPDVFLSESSARFAASVVAANHRHAVFCQIAQHSRIAADKTRESGFIARLFDGQRRFLGYAAEG